MYKVHRRDLYTETILAGISMGHTLADYAVAIVVHYLCVTPQFYLFTNHQSEDSIWK